MQPFGAIPIIESPFCYEDVWFRCPRSKRKRIQAKWRRDRRNWRREDRVYLVDFSEAGLMFGPRGPQVFMPPGAAAKLRDFVL